MTVQKRIYNNATVYRFKTDLLTDGKLSGQKALNIVSIFNDGKSMAIYQRFWTDRPDPNERVLRKCQTTFWDSNRELRNSQEMYYIERAICIKPETLQIINQIIEL